MTLILISTGTLVTNLFSSFKSSATHPVLICRLPSIHLHSHQFFIGFLSQKKRSHQYINPELQYMMSYSH